MEQTMPEEAKPSVNIEEILREHDRLSRLIEKEFTREVTILFTDICGYTQYTGTMGDIRSRAMLQKHNDLLFALVEAHHGVVVKTIGDAIMAYFEAPLDAIKTAVAIQKTLFDYNAKTEPAGHIHVKIGIHAGTAIVEKTDIFGDAVNVAARVQGKSGKDMILISKPLYERIGSHEDIICRFHETALLKGISEPMNLYRVIWREEDLILSNGPALRSEPGTAGRRPIATESVFHVELTRDQERIRVSAWEESAGESKTIRHYEEIQAPLPMVEERCNDIVGSLNKVNREGKISREVLFRLRETGRILFDDLLPADVRERLTVTKAEHLCMTMDDQLVQIPWELLHDGKHFLCQRFSMGRLVRTRQPIGGPIQQRPLAYPLKMLIVSGGADDLPEAAAEAAALRDFMEQHGEWVNAAFRDEQVTPDFIREKLGNFDLVHYAGHSAYDPENPDQSGWLLETGKFTAGDVMQWPEGPIPAFVFSNACQSARTGEWRLDETFQNKVFGMANAFVLKGVKHYVGTFWEVLDEPSSRFALEFYKHLLEGRSAGQAMRAARLSLIQTYGEETILWASYLLYGDPAARYVDKTRSNGVKRRETPAESGPASRPHPQTPEGRAGAAPPVKASLKEAVLGNLKPYVAAAALLVLFLLALIAHRGGEGPKQAPPLDAAVMADISLGNRRFQIGDLEKAQTAYQKAAASTGANAAQQAEALMGLGRVASIRKQWDTALNYYQQASERLPEAAHAYMAQAVVYQNTGKPREALEVLETAARLAPGDPGISAMGRDLRRRLELEEDHEKQEAVDRLVQELIADMKSPSPAPASPALDDWTSRPLSIWVMDVDVTGYSLQEGEEQLVVAGIQHRLAENSRFQLVERAVLDKLLKELKLGSSAMADRQTALAVGKILAARVLLAGRVTYAGPEKQISLRAIETETGRIVGTAGESFPAAASAAVMSEKLAGALAGKLEAAYPVRGVITAVNGEEIVLNIGEKAGVQTAGKFSMVGTDGMLEIVSVMPAASVVKVVAGTISPTKGAKVELVRQSPGAVL